MKKLLLGILVCVLTVTLAACGANKSKDSSGSNNSEKDKSSKEMTMSDIIFGKEKRAILRVNLDNENDLVTRINIVKDGKVKSLYVRDLNDSSDNPNGNLPLSKASKMSVDELEKYGKQTQQEAKMPPAFYMPVKYWVSDGEVSYGLLGYDKYYSIKGVNKPGEYEYGSTQEEASKHFVRVSNFKKDPNASDAYKFDAIPNLNEDEAGSNGYSFDNEINNGYMETSDGNKIVGYNNEHGALLTKVNKDVKLVPEKDE